MDRVLRDGLWISQAKTSTTTMALEQARVQPPVVVDAKDAHDVRRPFFRLYVHHRILANAAVIWTRWCWYFIMEEDVWQPHADGASVPLLALRRLARARRAPCRVRRVPVPTIGEYFFAELLRAAPQRVDASPQPADVVADVRPTGPLPSAVFGRCWRRRRRRDVVSSREGR